MPAFFKSQDGGYVGRGREGVVVQHRVVIVGSSVGGVRAARALRAEGYPGRIILVGEEPELPYDRPPLSKQVLSGAWPTERAGLLTMQAAADAEIELRLGVRAQALDAEARLVHLAGGELLPYDDLVIATGASPRPSPWRAESGIYLLRTLADCLALKERFTDGATVVMIGGGFIGAETAAAARSAGCDVTLVDPVPVPMERAAGPVVGALLADVHRRNGVRTRFGVGMHAVSGRAGDLAITLTDGSVLRAGTVVVGIGAIPNDQWLQGSGLAVEDGIICDAHLAAAGAQGRGASCGRGGPVVRRGVPELAQGVRAVPAAARRAGSGGTGQRTARSIVRRQRARTPQSRRIDSRSPSRTGPAASGSSKSDRVNGRDTVRRPSFSVVR